MLGTTGGCGGCVARTAGEHAEAGFACRSRAHLQQGLVTAILATADPLRPYWSPHATVRPRRHAAPRRPVLHSILTHLRVVWGLHRTAVAPAV